MKFICAHCRRPPGCKTLTLYCVKEREFKKRPFRVYCLVLSSRFQRLAVAFLALGSHLYTAQQDSMRQGSWGSVLQTLVGRPVTLGLRSPRLLCLYYITGFAPCQDLFFGYLKPHSLRGFKVAVLSGYFVSLSLSRFCVLFGSLLSHSRPFASWSAVCRRTLTSPAISRSQFTACFDKVFMLTLYHFAGPAQRFVGFSFPFCVFIISQDFRPVKTFF